MGCIRGQAGEKKRGHVGDERMRVEARRLATQLIIIDEWRWIGMDMSLSIRRLNIYVGLGALGSMLWAESTVSKDKSTRAGPAYQRISVSAHHLS